VSGQFHAQANFPPRKGPLLPTEQGKLWEARAGLDALKYKKISSPPPEIEPRFHCCQGHSLDTISYNRSRLPTLSSCSRRY